MAAHPSLKKGRLPIWRRLGWRLGVSVVLLTSLGILVSGSLQYRAQEQWLRQSLGSLLLNIARTGALLVDSELHTQVQTTLTQDSEAYGRLQKSLALIQDENQIETPIYTLTDLDADRRQARFMVTSRGPGLPGEAYPLVPALLEPLRRAFLQGVATHTDIYRNQSGTWITAFAPIRNSAGRTVAVLDVDFRADVYLRELAAIRRRFYLFTLAGGLVALAFGVLLARNIVRPVGQLAALAQRVVEGDLSTRVRVATRNEIGMLGNVLHLMVERLSVSNRSMVDVLTRVLEAREDEPGGLKRLATAALALGDRLEVTATQREALELGALLHDIGDIKTPEAILGKPGSLTPGERRVMEEHPTAGIEVIETVPLLTPALDIVGGHHERWDGAGYPQGLKGEEIPFTARIFAVVDALEAMTHVRPHRAARPISGALEVLRQEQGKQFDPRVVEGALAIPRASWAALLGCPDA